MIKRLFFLILAALLLAPATRAQGQPAGGPDRISVRYGARSLELLRESVRTDFLANTLEGVYANKALPGLTLKVVTSPSYRCGQAIREHAIEIASKNPLTEDLTVYFPLKSLEGVRRAVMPLKYGTFGELADPGERIATYRSAGKQEPYDSDLALPLLIAVGEGESSTAVLTDPWFSSAYDRGCISWCYSKEVGLEDAVERRTILEAEGVKTLDEGMELYYNTILKEVPPGPAWTHDIAMVSYDYLSDEGKGWYNDIDTLCTMTTAEDRAKIALCIHGWYDVVGRYSFNETTDRMDPSWTSQLRNRTVTLEELRHRIGYAKQRGFRVLMYFADGILASKGLPGYNEKEALAGREYRWEGPDVLGGSYLRNLAYPRQADFFRRYARALFTEFAPQVDGFVWDETFYIAAGDQGGPHKWGYLPRTQMRLVKEITTMLHGISPQCAFFTSDLVSKGNHDTPPYALMADGTYQDSQCIPRFWSGGIFPNYRNVLWSCNWHPLQTFRYTLFGVMAYNTPVVFTNGWGEDKGLSEMTSAEKRDFMKLFAYRKQFTTRLRYFHTLPPYYDLK